MKEVLRVSFLPLGDKPHREKEASQGQLKCIGLILAKGLISVLMMFRETFPIVLAVLMRKSETAGKSSLCIF